jgi:hypothetical protein
MRGSQVELARWCRLVGTTVWPGCDPAVRLAIGLRDELGVLRRGYACSADRCWLGLPQCTSNALYSRS